MDSVPQQAQGVVAAVIESDPSPDSPPQAHHDGNGDLTEDPYSPGFAALPQLLGLLIALTTLSVPMAAVLTSRPQPKASQPNAPELSHGASLKSTSRDAAAETPRR